MRLIHQPQRVDTLRVRVMRHAWLVFKKKTFEIRQSAYNDGAFQI